MAKKKKSTVTTIHVVDFQKKQIVISADVTTPGSQKDVDSMEQVYAAIDMIEKTFKKSKKAS